MARFPLQAIVTTYHGATNTRNSRIVAKASAGRVSVSYDHSLSADDNHAAVANQFAVSKGWLDGWRLEAGALPDGCSICHVLVKA